MQASIFLIQASVTVVVRESSFFKLVCAVPGSAGGCEGGPGLCGRRLGPPLRDAAGAFCCLSSGLAEHEICRVVYVP